jgi:hypothetical protein
MIFGFLIRLMMIIDIIGRPMIKVVLNTKLGWWWRWWRRRRRAI